MKYDTTPYKNVNELTQIINLSNREMSESDHQALSMIYDQLKSIARTQKYKVSHKALNTTALVNEAWLKIYKNNRFFNDRNHFYATSAMAMRQILLNQAKKHINCLQSQSYDEDEIRDHHEALWLLDLEKNLNKLANYSKRLEEIFIYRYFGGMKIDEIAGHLSLSKRTVNRDWKKAKLMLSIALS